VAGLTCPEKKEKRPPGRASTTVSEHLPAHRQPSAAAAPAHGGRERGNLVKAEMRPATVSASNMSSHLAANSCGASGNGQGGAVSAAPSGPCRRCLLRQDRRGVVWPSHRTLR
jgi:hypothetical protein